MLLKALEDGAEPVIWKPVIEYVALDCGGRDFDEIDYKPFCPKCGKELDLFISNYCPNCGTKLWKHYRWPSVVEERKGD